MLSPRRVLFLVVLFSLTLPSLAQAGVQPSYDLSTPDGGPFPSDRWTAVDWSQLDRAAGRPPKPDCAARPSDCADIDVLNTLDGFNIQPRISIPFTGPIDPTSVSSSTVFLIRLPDHAHRDQPDRVGAGRRTRCTSRPTSCSQQGTSLHARRHSGVRDASGDRSRLEPRPRCRR